LVFSGIDHGSDLERQIFGVIDEHDRSASLLPSVPVMGDDLLCGKINRLHLSIAGYIHVPKSVLGAEEIAPDQVCIGRNLYGNMPLRTGQS
jgi:hypothetical protein